MLLFLPKLLNQFMYRSAPYQKWAASVSISTTIQQRMVIFTVVWFLIEGSRNKALWSSMVLYLLYLLRFPWFWGHVTSENGDISPMYMFGWRINGPHTKNSIRLGNPDVLSITLPFMYFIVTPLLLLIYGLYAERSATCFQSSTRRTIGTKPEIAVGAGSPNKTPEAKTTSSLMRLGTRRRVLLFLASVVFTCMHLKQCCSLMGAYGVGIVTLSPAFSWKPPLLLAAALYSTSKP